MALEKSQMDTESDKADLAKRGQHHTDPRATTPDSGMRRIEVAQTGQNPPSEADRLAGRDPSGAATVKGSRP